MELKLINDQGQAAATVAASDSLFARDYNEALVHQVVVAYQANARSGNRKQKDREEVRHSTKKPFRQKGTGGARQGSTRAPHFSGGGIALGPKPRKYGQKTPRKMVRLALASALSDRNAQGRVVVVDAWSFTSPSTKDATKALEALGVSGKVLVVVTPGQDNVIKSFRNLVEVQLILTSELNAYDVLCNDWVVFSTESLPATSEKETSR